MRTNYPPWGSAVRPTSVLIVLQLISVGSTHAAPCMSRRAGAVPAAYRETVARMRTLVCERLSSHIPGVQVAVAIDGTLVWSEGFGYADAARRRPVTRATQFRIGRVAKPPPAPAEALSHAHAHLRRSA